MSPRRSRSKKPCNRCGHVGGKVYDKNIIWIPVDKRMINTLLVEDVCGKSNKSEMHAVYPTLVGQGILLHESHNGVLEEKQDHIPETDCTQKLCNNASATGFLKPVRQSTQPQTDQESQSASDVDLTCLNWLPNVKLMSGVSLPTPPISPEPSNNNNAIIESPPVPSPPPKPPIDYRVVAQKPPYSYARLISMAMRDNGNIMTLSAIYSWIRNNYLYYQLADPSWHNSIRHNLSLNKIFVKVPRAKDEPGKGGFWRLDNDPNAPSAPDDAQPTSPRKRSRPARRFRPRTVKPALLPPAPEPQEMSVFLQQDSCVFADEYISTAWLASHDWSDADTDLEFLDAILDNFGPGVAESI